MDTKSDCTCSRIPASNGAEIAIGTLCLHADVEVLMNSGEVIHGGPGTIMHVPQLPGGRPGWWWDFECQETTLPTCGVPLDDVASVTPLRSDIAVDSIDDILRDIKSLVLDGEGTAQGEWLLFDTDHEQIYVETTLHRRVAKCLRIDNEDGGAGRTM